MSKEIGREQELADILILPLSACVDIALMQMPDIIEYAEEALNSMRGKTAIMAACSTFESTDAADTREIQEEYLEAIIELLKVRDKFVKTR